MNIYIPMPGDTVEFGPECNRTTRVVGEYKVRRAMNAVPKIWFADRSSVEILDFNDQRPALIRRAGIPDHLRRGITDATPIVSPYSVPGMLRNGQEVVLYPCGSAEQLGRSTWILMKRGRSMALVARNGPPETSVKTFWCPVRVVRPGLLGEAVLRATSNTIIGVDAAH